MAPITQQLEDRIARLEDVIAYLEEKIALLEEALAPAVMRRRGRDDSEVYMEEIEDVDSD